MNAFLPILFAALALRNPFWPIGYDGPRETISAQPTVVVKTAPTNEVETTAAAAATLAPLEEDPEVVTSRHWAAARATLKIGGIVSVKGANGSRRQSVTINGLIYGNGDLVSVNHEGRRFTWRVKGLTEGKTLRLERLRVKELDESEQPLLKGNKK